ncbi:MAG: hypothetical protein E6K80_00845 [Candidatus Eisenbacteria bacterium]|uniref:Dipeptidylpeptidase IV N-terminal domain-containing protein n=1 Tax=Eiseniibacteriota bacterium TaxID=2212470 RepID=A0A538UB57_UNCEI|nr:MAG: hypothetical protein E6K80_00845 [Candidatus Eisenbacteria bacterium]
MNRFPLFFTNPDGTGLRQVTSGGGNDFDPLYLPDDRILFTSSRDGEMDEYNHSASEHLYVCDADGGSLERISYNQSDDFDPQLLPDGHVVYTRWEHFGTMNRFPLFFTNPDGTGTFHMFGPHDRNFFHVSPTPDGRLVAIASTRVEEDAGQIAVLKLEQGPADPVIGSSSTHWDVITPQVNTDGAPWPYGAFKYPVTIGGNRYVASYTLPAATDRHRRAGRSGDLHARQPDVPLQRSQDERVRRPAAGAASEAARHSLDDRPQRGLRRVPGAGRLQSRHERRPGSAGEGRRPDRQHRGHRRAADDGG